ncbi:MAG: hypothetical protein V3U72_01695 [Candidatus Aenigmarchaeota archaeon]
MLDNMGAVGYILLSAIKALTPSDSMPNDIKYIPLDYKRKPAIELRLEKAHSNVNSVLSNSISGDLDPAYSGTSSMNPPVDDLVEDTKILEKFGKIYAKVKDKGFPYRMSVDVNGDGTDDNFVFTLEKGSSVTAGINVTPGTRFTMEFTSLSGGWKGTKIYGIVGGDGKIKIAKRKWLTPTNAKKYLDVVLKYYEK